MDILLISWFIAHCGWLKFWWLNKNWYWQKISSTLDYIRATNEFQWWTWATYTRSCSLFAKVSILNNISTPCLAQHGLAQHWFWNLIYFNIYFNFSTSVTVRLLHLKSSRGPIIVLLEFITWPSLAKPRSSNC